jgi:hypothetical protein
MDSESVQNLLDYIFNEDDFDENPSMNEYKKIKRIMSVMVDFYVRGRDAKKSQQEKALQELEKVAGVEKLMNDRLDILKQFPSFHPKRQSYEEELNYDMEELLNHKKKFTEQHENYSELYVWGIGIAETMNWLQDNLEEYGWDVLKIDAFNVERNNKVNIEQYLKYKKGLEEVTYNLQESQDFFEASLDGRLQRYHQLEKCMIEAQMMALQSFPDENPRKLPDLAELKKDLDFVIETMTITPSVLKRRERMKQMHKDFFSVLKWQREKMIKILETDNDKIEGDINLLREQLKIVIQEINEMRAKSQNSNQTKKVEAFRTMGADQDKIHKIYDE